MLSMLVVVVGCKHFLLSRKRSPDQSFEQAYGNMFVLGGGGEGGNTAARPVPFKSTGTGQSRYELLRSTVQQCIVRASQLIFLFSADQP